MNAVRNTGRDTSSIETLGTIYTRIVRGLTAAKLHYL
jgi:hypothetical protein